MFAVLLPFQRLDNFCWSPRCLAVRYRIFPKPVGCSYSMEYVLKPTAFVLRNCISLPARYALSSTLVRSHLLRVKSESVRRLNFLTMKAALSAFLLKFASWGFYLVDSSWLLVPVKGEECRFAGIFLLGALSDVSHL